MQTKPPVDQEKQNHALARSFADAHRGLDVRNFLPPKITEGCFLLTSPFIEPAPGPILKRDRLLLIGELGFSGD
jgi:hypothetical protein